MESVELADKVRFLRRPATYTPRPARITAIETHMAWVFLAGELAFKLKKPVRYHLLDYSTLGARRRACWQEVRLNRRLAPHVYLGVVPLVSTPGRELALDGPGTPVDWLVRMRRLSVTDMLDRRIVSRSATVRRRDVNLAGFALDAGSGGFTDRGPGADEVVHEKGDPPVHGSDQHISRDDAFAPLLVHEGRTACRPDQR